MGQPFFLDDPDGSLRRGSSAEQRLTEAIRRHYRRFGAAPSYRELEQATSIRRSDICRHLRRLADKGVLELNPGVARGIQLRDRGAMLSDVELELAAAARGARIGWPRPVASGLATAYKLLVGTDYELPVEDLLLQLDAIDLGAEHVTTADFKTGAPNAGKGHFPPPPQHQQRSSARRRP